MPHEQALPANQNGVKAQYDMDTKNIEINFAKQCHTVLYSNIIYIGYIIRRNTSNALMIEIRYWDVEEKFHMALESMHATSINFASSSAAL